MKSATQALGDSAWKPDDGFVMRTAPVTARLIALRRNPVGPMPRVAPLRVADLEIDALTTLIRRGTREIRLSPVEHILLYTVAARAGAVVNYGELADALGRIGSDMRNNTLARHLSSLRRKLGDDAHQPRYIETVLGVGYRLVSARKP